MWRLVISWFPLAPEKERSLKWEAGEPEMQEGLLTTEWEMQWVRHLPPDSVSPSETAPQWEGAVPTSPPVQRIPPLSTH